MISAPDYIQFPQLYRNGSLSAVDWGSSFRLNGQLREYIVVLDGRVVLRGVTTVYQADLQTSVNGKKVVYFLNELFDT